MGKRYRRKKRTRDGMRRLSNKPYEHLDSSALEFESIYEVENFYLRESVGERIERLANDLKLEPIHMMQVLLVEGLNNLERLPVDEAREHVHQTVNFKELWP